MSIRETLFPPLREGWLSGAALPASFLCNRGDKSLKTLRRSGRAVVMEP